MARTLGIRFRGKHKQSPGRIEDIPVQHNQSVSDPAEPIIDTDPAGNERATESADIWESTGDDGIIDPATLTSGSGDSTGTDTGTGKRRGRPRGSKNGTTGNKGGGRSASQTASNIETMLFSGHMMLAAFLKTPELALDADEAKKLSEAVSTVANLYEVPLLDEKSQAWLGLAMCGGMIYFPRVVAVMNNRKKNRPQAVQAIRGIL